MEPDMRSKSMKTMLLLATIVLAGTIGLGQTSTTTIDQVEEDWQVVIGTPNSTEIGPQLTTCMSPVSDGSTPFFALDMNYRDYPSYEAGGLETAVISSTDGSVQDYATQGDGVLGTTNETITWTQRMSLSGGTVTYTVVNGQSTTWGTFGQDGGLDPISFTTSVTSLASYSPDTSVAKSGVGWQSNRVSQMTLVRVRYYSGGRLVSTDTTSRSVDLSID
jgi:hypothetical protein